MDIMREGVRQVWARSPTQGDIQDCYHKFEKVHSSEKKEAAIGQKMKESRAKEKRKEDEKRRVELTQGDSVVRPPLAESSEASDDEPKKKKRKKEKKEKKKEKKRIEREKESEEGDEKKKKKEKKDKKRKREKENEGPSAGGGGEDEWVEVTHEMREQRQKQEKEEEQHQIGPAIPAHLLARDNPAVAAAAAGRVDTANMLKGEAEAMAAYIAAGKRIPRRGEIGLSSEEISVYEKAGYVMSGSRHKAMEATRLRKENQVLTSEEKRMLSGFSVEERKKKEDAVLNQFKNLIDSKRATMNQ